MSIIADLHLHTKHSSDSKASMESMIEQGISLGLSTVCFTEHMDLEYPDIPGNPPEMFQVNTDSYLYDLICCREKYAGQLEVLFGIELGMQAQLSKEQARYVKSYDFDFVIGSAHLCEGRDPYYSSFYEERREEDAYQEYFDCVLSSIRAFSNFDVYGHLDYVVRYGPNKDAFYSYDKYHEVLDNILRLLIDKGKGLEINTGGIKYNLRDLHPCMDILKRYRQLGGEIITVGSDAHAPGNMAKGFDRAQDMLKECGFRYYTVFRRREGMFVKI